MLLFFMNIVHGEDKARDEAYKRLTNIFLAEK